MPLGFLIWDVIMMVIMTPPAQVELSTISAHGQALCVLGLQRFYPGGLGNAFTVFYLAASPETSSDGTVGVCAP